MRPEAGPVLRFKNIVRTEDGVPFCAVVIGWNASIDAAWEALAVDDRTLQKWQAEIADARQALRQAKEKRK